MAIGQGFKTKTAFRKEGPQIAYGTPVACGTGDQYPLIAPFNPQKVIAREFSHEERYKNGTGFSKAVLRSTQGQGTFRLVYKGLEELLVCITGFSNAAEDVDTGVYKQSFKLADNMHSEPITAGHGILAGDGFLAGDSLVRRGTLCINKDVSIWEYISSNIKSALFRGTSQGVRLDVDFLCRDLDLNSSTNTSPSTWTISAGDDWSKVFWQDIVFWVGDYSTETALDSDDALGITEFEIKIEHNPVTKQDTQSETYISDPRQTGQYKVTGAFKVPRYQNDTLIDKLDAETKLMAMIRFIGPEIGATGYYYTYWFWLPTFYLDVADAPLDNPGIIPNMHTFTTEIPAAASAGFPTVATKELLIQLQTDYSVNPIIQ